MKEQGGLSLELKLPLATSALLILLLGLYTWIGYREVASTTRLSASERDTRLASDLAQITGTSSLNRARLNARVVNRPAVRQLFTSGSFENAAAALDSMRTVADSSFDVVLFDAQRRPLHTIGAPLDPELLGAATPLMDAADKADSVSARSPFFEYRGRAHFWGVTAVKQNGRLLGFVAQLRPVRTNPASAKTLQSLIGQDNRILFANDRDTRSGWVRLEGDMVPAPSEQANDEHGWRYRRGQTWYIAGRETIPGTPWQIIVESPESITQVRPQQFLRRTGLLGLLLLLGATAVVWIASRRITGPIRDLHAAAVAIEHGNLDERVHIDRDDELGRLGSSFNQMAAEVQRSMEAVQEANRAKSEFLANMSHEIRTPINAILGYTDLMDIGVAGEVTETQKQHLERIRVSGNHLIGLIDDLLDFARLDVARMSVESREVMAGDSVKTALTVVAPQADAKPVSISVECERDARYVGDPQRVEQILVNLLGNAVKFTSPNGQVTLTCRMVREDGVRRTEFEVTDTGVGIPPDRLEAIFEPFVQAKGGYTRPHGGTGLGLSISRRLAELMNGTITVQSEVDKGARFTLTLPAPQ